MNLEKATVNDFGEIKPSLKLLNHTTSLVDPSYLGENHCIQKDLKNRSVQFFGNIESILTFQEQQLGMNFLMVDGVTQDSAFGDIDLCASELLRQSPKKAFELWGLPQSLAELSGIIINYLKGDLKSLPWSDGPVGDDTKVIVDDLIYLNQHGFFTMNSQPALNAVKSSEKFLLAPKWICVSKQYLEFFCHKDVVSKLLDHVEEFNVKGAESSSAFISYYAVDKDGNLSTNCKDDDINAVTWGYFRERKFFNPQSLRKHHSWHGRMRFTDCLLNGPRLPVAI